MKCPSCGDRMSIIYALTGRKHSCSQNRELQDQEQRVLIQRLMNAAPSDDPQPLKPPRSNGSAIAPETPVMEPAESQPTAVDPDSVASEVACTGSWRCQCP